MPGIREIAREVGVSISTVSYALNGTRPISDDTRNQILATVERLGYRPDARGRSLGAMRSRVVGVVIPSLTTYFMAPLVSALDEALFKRGYRLLIAHAEREREFHRLFDKGQVDGVIAIVSTALGGEIGETLVAHFKGQPQPCVIVNRSLSGVACVRVNYLAGAFQAVSHLADLGHKRIGFVGQAATDPTQVALLAGYKSALQKLGLHPDPRWIAPDSHSAFVQGAQLPTAFFVAGQFHTFPFYREARNRHMRIPEDIAVVGFDDDTNEADLSPPLTTVAQPHGEVGEKAVDLLIAGIEGGQIQQQDWVIDPHFVLRESCGGAQSSLG